jgi:hypothetical protein
MAKENDGLTTPQFTVKDLVDLIKTMNEENQNNLKLAISEMKKPNEFEQRKIDLEEAKIARQRQMRRDEMLNEQEVRLAAQKACNHKRRTKDGFASGWAGQVNNDGYIRFICVSCQMVAPEVKAPDEWKTNGVNAQDPNGPLYHLTLEQIKQWHTMYGAKPITRIKGQLETVGA